jgi:hypothetical protein
MFLPSGTACCRRAYAESGGKLVFGVEYAADARRYGSGMRMPVRTSARDDDELYGSAKASQDSLGCDKP